MLAQLLFKSLHVATDVKIFHLRVPLIRMNPQKSRVQHRDSIRKRGRILVHDRLVKLVELSFDQLFHILEKLSLKSGIKKAACLLSFLLVWSLLRLFSLRVI